MPFGPYDAGGVRTVEPIRDVHDIISRIDPEKTPILTRFPIKSTSQIKVEFLTDSLAAHDPENAHPIGGNAPAALDTTRVLEYNYVQTFVKTAAVSDIQDRVKQYGMDSEMAYQKTKKLAEVKLDIESRLVSDGERQEPTPANADTGKFRGIPRTITTNVDAGGTFTQPLFTTLQQTIVTAGGDPDSVYCDATRKIAISAFTATDRRAFQDPKEIIETIEVYESDFGQVKVFWHPLMPTTIAAPTLDAELLLLQMNLFDLAELEPFAWIDLARTGTAQRQLGRWTLTLRNRNQLGSGAFKNL